MEYHFFGRYLFSKILGASKTRSRTWASLGSERLWKFICFSKDNEVVDDIEVGALMTSLASKGSWKQRSLRLEQTVLPFALYLSYKDLV